MRKHRQVTHQEKGINVTDREFKIMKAHQLDNQENIGMFNYEDKDTPKKFQSEIAFTNRAFNPKEFDLDYEIDFHTHPADTYGGLWNKGYGQYVMDVRSQLSYFFNSNKSKIKKIFKSVTNKKNAKWLNEKQKKEFRKEMKTEFDNANFSDTSTFVVSTTGSIIELKIDIDELAKQHVMTNEEYEQVLEKEKGLYGQLYNNQIIMEMRLGKISKSDLRKYRYAVKKFDDNVRKHGIDYDESKFRELSISKDGMKHINKHLIKLKPIWAEIYQLSAIKIIDHGKNPKKVNVPVKIYHRKKRIVNNKEHSRIRSKIRGHI